MSLLYLSFFIFSTFKIEYYIEKQEIEDVDMKRATKWAQGFRPRCLLAITAGREDVHTSVEDL